MRPCTQQGQAGRQAHRQAGRPGKGGHCLRFPVPAAELHDRACPCCSVAQKLDGSVAQRAQFCLLACWLAWSLKPCRGWPSPRRKVRPSATARSICSTNLCRKFSQVGESLSDCFKNVPGSCHCQQLPSRKPAARRPPPAAHRCATPAGRCCPGAPPTLPAAPCRAQSSPQELLKLPGHCGART